MFFQVQKLSIVRRDIDICSQFQVDNLEQREARLESQLGAVRDVSCKAERDTPRAPVLSQFYSPANLTHTGGSTGNDARDEADMSDDILDEEDASDQVQVVHVQLRSVSTSSLSTSGCEARMCHIPEHELPHSLSVMNIFVTCRKTTMLKTMSMT